MSNRCQFTTYVNSKQYDAFIKKCKQKETTPYAVLKSAIVKFISEDTEEYNDNYLKGRLLED